MGVDTPNPHIPHKTCNLCGLRLLTTEFYRKGNGLGWACKSCIRGYTREQKRHWSKTEEGKQSARKSSKLRLRSEKNQRAGERKWRAERMHQLLTDLTQTHGMSQYEIADRIGVSQATVSYWWLRKRPPIQASVTKVLRLWRQVTQVT